MFNTENNVTLGCQVLKDRREPRHSIAHSVRKHDWNHLLRLRAALFGYLSNWGLNLDILLDALQMSERSLWKYILSELHESINGTLSILRPFLITARCFIFSWCRVVHSDSISGFQRCHYASNFELPAP
jgi:hypothetical protein